MIRTGVIVLILAGIVISLNPITQAISAVLEQRAISSIRASATASAILYNRGLVRQGGIMDGFDAAHRRWNPYEQAITPATINRLRPLWTYNVEMQHPSVPTVAGGMVYVLDGQNLLVFDATCRQNCRPLWSYPVTNQLGYAPIVAGDLVYALSVHLEEPASRLTLLVFDATCRQDCQPLWTYELRVPVAPVRMLAASERFYLSSARQVYVFGGHCRSACRPLGSYAVESDIDALAAAGDVVYLNTLDKRGSGLSAIDARCVQKCSALWHYYTTKFTRDASDDGTALTIGNRVLYVRYGDALAAFDTACRGECQPLWQYVKRFGLISHSPAIMANNLLYLSSIEDGVVIFDGNCRKDCRPLGKYKPRVRDEEVDLPRLQLVAGGVLYLRDADNQLLAFDAACRQNCQSLWSYTDRSNLDATPVIANGMIYWLNYPAQQLTALGVPL